MYNIFLALLSNSMKIISKCTKRFDCFWLIVGIEELFSMKIDATHEMHRWIKMNLASSNLIWSKLNHFTFAFQVKQIKTHTHTHAQQQQKNGQKWMKKNQTCFEFFKRNIKLNAKKKEQRVVSRVSATKLRRTTTKKRKVKMKTPTKTIPFAFSALFWIKCFHTRRSNYFPFAVNSTSTGHSVTRLTGQEKKSDKVSSHAVCLTWNQKKKKTRCLCCFALYLN